MFSFRGSGRGWQPQLSALYQLNLRGRIQLAQLGLGEHFGQEVGLPDGQGLGVWWWSSEGGEAPSLSTYSTQLSWD